ncbi:hypothetical protein HUJ05_005263 [Dendroctonus ponderosae]|nr:hypothetical protein HUJ05_005263 [Dendroctonus ponderosae]
MEGSTREEWSEFLENIPTGDADPWKVSKALRETTKTFFPPIHGERGLVYTDEEKAEAFADSLERQFSPNMSLTDDLDFEEEVENILQEIKHRQTPRPYPHFKSHKTAQNNDHKHNTPPLKSKPPNTLTQPTDNARNAIETLLLILPSFFFMVIAVLLSSLLHQSKTWAFVLEFLIIVVPQQKTAKRATPINPTKKDYITNCRATINLLSVIAILAVDFTIFPARFSKTLTTGFSLMDVGVGLFVFANGIVAPEVRGKRDSIGSSIRGSLCLLVIGILRLVLTKLTHYNVSESEYGVHWNFFITLAFTKIFSSCVLNIVKPKYVLINATLILIAHETLLQLSFKTWIFNHFERHSFTDANKEGLVSAIGYLALYLYSVYFGYSIKQTEKSYRITNGKFFVITMTSLLMTIFCNYHFEVSRRLANAGYVFWVLFIGIFMTWLFYLAENAQKHIFEGITKHYLCSPYIYEAINYNGLIFFIIGNLLTGLVNLSISTKQVLMMKHKIETLLIHRRDVAPSDTLNRKCLTLLGFAQ